MSMTWRSSFEGLDMHPLPPTAWSGSVLRSAYTWRATRAVACVPAPSPWAPRPHSEIFQSASPSAAGGGSSTESTLISWTG
eukprot:1236591-Prorocentrum_lima.AAC.1